MLRPPAVAGFFYPDDPVQLRNQVHFYLDAVDSQAKAPKAIVVPHAGYQYSGAIAASAYARLKSHGNQIQRVVIVGPCHRVAFRGVALSSADVFSTPLGSIPVDLEAVKAISQLAYVAILDQAHAQEHSLEVQLPFLQEVLDEFNIVPLVVGDASAEQVAEILKQLWGGNETLIVISSDLSHYHNYETANKKDTETSRFIERLQYENLDYDSACGKVPLAGLLKLAREQNLTIKTIDLRNSGDTSGNKSRVVGYGAYVID
jgi:AmmeMemoRadiSam system protein B